MRVVVAPDSFGGTLTPPEAADAVRTGWALARPDDEVVTLPMSDGGEGLLDAFALARPDALRHRVEVVGPLGTPVEAEYLALADGTAVLETAQACGLRLVPAERRDPLRTTTWGVGELVTAAARAGATRLLIGLGGSATVDGGAGALSGLGLRVTVGDGSGLKIGGEDLPRVAAVAPGWTDDALAGLQEVVILADVATPLGESAARFGPQKGADAAAVAHLRDGLTTWARVVSRDLQHAPPADGFGTGAAGGLGFALAAALGGRIVAGAPAVADAIGLPAAIESADVVVTGEGRVDPTSLDGKVVGTVVALARAARARAVVVAGQLHGDLGDVDLVVAPQDERGAAVPVREAVAAFAHSL